MKKVTGLLLALVMIVTLFAGCQPADAPPAETPPPADTSTDAPAPPPEEQEPEKELTFGYIAWNMKDEWNQYGEEAFRWAAEKKGVKVVSEDGKNSPEEQVKIAEGFINQGVDAISLFPCTPEVGATIVRMCNEANIPIAIENIFLPEDGSAGNFVGQVACQYNDIGYAAIQYVAEKFPGAKLFYCAGSVGMGVYESYKIGVDQALEDFAGKVELVETLHGDWETEKSMQVTQDFIATGKEFDVIFANNDLQARGCYNALKEAGMEDIPVISTGGAPVGLDMIREGTQYANMTAPVNIQGLIVFRFLWQAVNGVTPPETKIPLPVIPVDVSNIDTAISWDNNDGALEYIGGIEP
jgi:ribose transport system substrate-binding protein